MIDAYVLLRVKPGMDRSVFQTVKKLKQVKDLETLYGEYDLLMKIQVETMDDLDKKHGGSEQIRLRCTP